MTREQFLRASIIDFEIIGIEGAIRQLESLRARPLFNTDRCSMYGVEATEFIQRVEVDTWDLIQQAFESRINTLKEEFEAL